MKVTLTQDRETKNKIRYVTDKDAAIDTVYVGKEAAKKLGEKITITVEPAK